MDEKTKRTVCCLIGGALSGVIAGQSTLPWATTVVLAGLVFYLGRLSK